jgi:cobyrinic acid a,c-diamide synthase
MLIAAPASGHGKTSITAALARLHRRRGLRVRCFKTGPDFIDPTMLVQASGQPVYNLDTWMMGVEHCRILLFEAAQNCDLILVEGAMGLFDGEPSSADLARQFGLPILPVINASSMAQTFGAVLHGLMTYRSGLEFVGAVANRVASKRHEQLLRMSVPADLALSVVQRSDAVKLPERHLGLQIADEICDLDERLDALADLLEQTPLAHLPAAIAFSAPQPINSAAPSLIAEPLKTALLLSGKIIGVAFDNAFCFLYQANLEWLQRMGARLHIFSPLDDSELPALDAIYLPGGYPELHAAKLAANGAMLDALNAHINAGKPVLAECGGMMYLTDALIDLNGDTHEMLGVLAGKVTMAQRLSAIGPQQLDIGFDDEAEGAGANDSDESRTSIRGHTFHYSSFDTPLIPAWHASTPDGRQGEAVYCSDSIIASYVHWYFPSNPELIARWLLGAESSDVALVRSEC